MAAAFHGWEEASEALRELELELIRRARLFLQEGVEDIRGHLADHSDERLPAPLAVCEEPPAALAGLIEALGRQAPSLGAAILTVGWAPPSAGLLARADRPMELEADLPCPKVLEPFLLDASVGREAIEIIREAYPPESVEDAVADESEETVRVVQVPTPARSGS